MTPDEARSLLDGTTPGPWKWRWDTGALSVFDVEEEPVATDLDVQDSDLIAAAPDMAHTIAGMTVEYGVHWPATDDFPAWTSWGFDTIEKAREHNGELTVPPETPGTIIRRYVGPWEAADAVD